QVGGTVVVSGLAFSGQSLRVRAQVEAGTVRVKVWSAVNAEPYGWTASATLTTYLSAGFVGIQSAIDSGSTNTNPLVFSYDNLTLRIPLFAGEVSEWPQDWDLSGNNITTTITAAGIRRRLSQGVSPQSSTLYRGNTAADPLPVAYWPCEDGKDATTLASGLGGPPMLLGGTTDLASYTGFAASSPIPVTKVGYWDGAVPSYTGTGFIQLRFLAHCPAATVDLALMAQLHTSGTSGNWEVKYRTGGGLSLECWSGGTQLLDSGPEAFGVDDADNMLSLELTQSGSDIDWKLARLEVGQTTGNVASGTLTGRTLGIATRVIITPYLDVSGVAIGHVQVRKEITSLFDLADELNAFSGELAAVRLARLCAQESIDFSVEGDPAQTVAMGVQRPISLIALLDECAAADFGTLYDPRGALGFAYRTGQALYNQDPVMTLDYSAAQVSAPFKPVRDDQTVRNDITANRPSGGSARAILEAGRLSVLPPDQGGAGRYASSQDTNTASDDQLPNEASWLLHLGTVDETRYPSVAVDLANVHANSDATLTQAARTLGVDDRFDVINPKPGQAPGPIQQLARGYGLTLGLFDYLISINSAPESPYHIGIYDDSGSRYDSDASTLHSGVTSSATSWSVDVADVTEGGLWTTTAGDFPFNLTVGGEVVTVTTIAGASSPQTFTVTRS
ncbi:MAG: hypothetical protein ACRER7_03295, partial [Gammaproteobacteria bacterium]